LLKNPKVCKDCAIGTFDEFTISSDDGKILHEKRDVKLYQDFDDISK